MITWIFLYTFTVSALDFPGFRPFDTEAECTAALLGLRAEVRTLDPARHPDYLSDAWCVAVHSISADGDSPK